MPKRVCWPAASFTCESTQTMSVAVRTKAMALLHARFVDHKTPSTQAFQQKLIDGVFGISDKQQWCNRKGQLVAMRGFDCAVGVVEDECVAVAVIRHVTKPRGDVPLWTELLFLAVAEPEEGRGYGTQMVEYVKELSADARSKLLVVISNGDVWWRREVLRLAKLTEL